MKAADNKTLDVKVTDNWKW